MKVRLSELAAAEIDAATAFLNACSPRAAAAFRTAVESAIGSLTDFPGRGRQGPVSGTRELVVRGAPYVVIYTADEVEVRVLRVRHVSQGSPR